MSDMRGREHRLLIEALYSYGGDREDRLTEVLASVLEVHQGLCRLLADRLGVQAQPERFVIQTQVGRVGQRRLVDLVLIAQDDQGTPLATIFVECKYNPTRKLEAYWFTQDQADRQRRALDEQPGQRILAGVCSKGDFDRLTGPPDRRPAFDPRTAYDQVVTWSEIRDLVVAAGGDPDQKATAGSAAASLPDRLLLEFLTYLDLQGDAVGALTDDDLFVLARVAQTVDRVDRLLWRAAETLADRMRAVDGSPQMEFEDDEDSDETTGAPRMWIGSDPPEGTWISELREGNLYIMVTGAEYDDEEEVGTATVYAGLGWNAGRAGRKLTAGSKWEKAANDAGLGLYWEGNVCNLLAARPLQEIVSAGNTITRQGDVLAAWAHQSIAAAMGLPAPPDANQDETPEAA
jgi:hypothetical protein